MRKLHLSQCILLIFFLCEHVHAEIGSQPIDFSSKTSPHEHDGFYFKFMTGTGYALYANMAENSPNVSDSLWHIDINIGYTLNNKVTIFTGIEGSILPAIFSFLSPMPIESPVYQVQSLSDGSAGDSGAIGGFPLGIIYYGLPKNIFTSFSISTMTAVFGDLKSDSNKSFTLKASVGREWWVSANWALGVALNLYYDYLAPQVNTNNPYHGFRIAFSVSTTYN